MNAVTTNFKWCIYTTLLAMFVFFQTSNAQDALTSVKYNIQNVRMSNDRLTISYDVYIQDTDNMNSVALPGYLFRLTVPLSDLGTNSKTVNVTNPSTQLGAMAVTMIVKDSNWLMKFISSRLILSYSSALMPSEAFPGTLIGTFNISNTDGTQFANPQVVNLNFAGTSPILKSTISIFNPDTSTLTLAPNSTAALPTTSFSGLQSYSLTAPVTCPAPTGLSASSITISGAQINWTSNTNVQNYRVYWKKSIGDSIWQYSPLLSDTANSYSITSLTSNTQYSYFVASICADQSLNSSAHSSFTTASSLLSVPVLISPANSSTGIQPNPILEWNAATNATSYRVQVSSSNSFSPLFLNEVVNSPSISFGMLLNSTTYYWRVCSKSATDSSAWSSVWSFSTNSGFALSGSLKYANSGQTPMNNCVIRLKDNNNTVIGTDTTDSQGYYSINAVPNGTYSIEILTTKQTGGISIADILAMRQAIAGSVTLSSIASKAADINANGSVNIQDVLPMRQKVANISPIATWLVPNYVFDPLQITINNANATLNIQALCGGDVNGSFVPTN